MTTDLKAAWSEIHDVKSRGWFVGTPVHIERRGWEQYAFDTRGCNAATAGPSTRESGRSTVIGRGTGRPSPARSLDLVG